MPRMDEQAATTIGGQLTEVLQNQKAARVTACSQYTVLLGILQSMQADVARIKQQLALITDEIGIEEAVGFEITFTTITKGA